MSGVDEQYLSKCPLCNEIPPYWALGNKVDSGLVWIYTGEYHRVHARDSIRFSVFNTPKNMDDIEHRIEYLWCGLCHTRIRDTSVVNLMFRRAKTLEEQGRVDRH